jgi:hypothetical protein
VEQPEIETTTDLMTRIKIDAVIDKRVWRRVGEYDEHRHCLSGFTGRGRRPALRCRRGGT